LCYIWDDGILNSPPAQSRSRWWQPKTQTPLNMSKIGNELIQVIKDKEFQGISKELIEVAIDSKLPESLLKEVPLLSTILGVFGTISSFKDRLFIQKLLTFLYELKSISEDKIVEQIIKLEDDNKYRTKVGEKLLYIIDKCDDTDKASLTANFFKAFLEKKIDYDEFLFGTNAIERTPLPDLLHFINNDFDNLDLEGGGSEYVSNGLMEIRVAKPKIEIKEEPYYDTENTYVPSQDEIFQERLHITNFEIKAYVNWTGENIRKYLKTR
jgi:hypothetical protein